VPEQNDEWKKEAVKRWGHRVEDLHFDDWATFVQSRMSTPPPASPHDLLQEYYAHDVWQLLCTCVLMSRVSSWETKHNTISAFFEAYPTPSHLLDVSDPDEVLKVIKPLGLFPGRMQSLVAISTKMLEMPQFVLGLNKEHKIYGIGEFGFQSYQIFCQNKGCSIHPGDKALAGFCNWQKKHEKKLGADDDDNDDEAAESEAEEDEEKENVQASDDELKAAAQATARAERNSRRKGSGDSEPPKEVKNEVVVTKARDGSPEKKKRKRATEAEKAPIEEKSAISKKVSSPVKEVKQKKTIASTTGTKQLGIGNFFSRK